LDSLPFLVAPTPPESSRYPFFSAQLNALIGALLAGTWLALLPKDVEMSQVPLKSWAWLSALLALQNSLEILSIPRAA